MSVASPSRAAFPGSQAGRHPRLHFRGLLRLHSNYGPLDRSTAQGGLCHRASIHPVTRTNRLPATRSNRQLSGWFLPPLVIRAFWAHWSRGEAQWLGRCGHHSVPVPARSNRTCGFPASGFPTGFTSKHTAVGQDGPDVVGSRPNSPNTTVSGKRMVPRDDTLWPVPPSPIDVELPPKGSLSGVVRIIATHPSLPSSKAHRKSGPLCSAGITRPHSSYGPVRRPRGPSPKVTLRARPSVPSPQITACTLPTCRAHLPRRTRTGAHVGCFPVPRGLPRISDGSASATSLSRPAQASLELRPSLSRPSGLCHRASIHPVTRTNRLPAPDQTDNCLGGSFLH